MKTNGTLIKYAYDAAGNRLSKIFTTATTGDSTYYVRDASGNVMSVYNKKGALNLLQTELYLYGTSRLGVYNVNIDVQNCLATKSLVTTFTRGNKFFELSNHLGNVLATISDKKLQVFLDGHFVSYYNADVVNANDYAPFGSFLTGRKYSQGGGRYKYGFNGKENDNDGDGGSLQYDYGFRIYDPHLGRFKSVDPLAFQYPWNSTYAFAENRPIDGVDLEGLEWAPTKDKQGNATDYSWVGYNDDGTAKAGSVASAFLNKGDFSYRYSSDAKKRSGQINVYSNIAKSTNHGWWSDKSTAFNYTISITGKFVRGMQGGWGYTQTAQVHDPETGTSSQEAYIGASNDRADPNGVRSREMFAATKSVFGLVPPPTALEPIYPESIFVPIAPKGFGLIGKGIGYAGAGYFKAGYKLFGSKSLKLETRLTVIGEADIRGLGYGQFDIAHMAFQKLHCLHTPIQYKLIAFYALSHSIQVSASQILRAKFG